jgi:hypothetical protein
MGDADIQPFDVQANNFRLPAGSVAKAKWASVKYLRRNYPKQPMRGDIRLTVGFELK